MSVSIPEVSPLTSAQEEKVHAPTDQWSENFALNIAKSDFEAAENYRRYHENRWINADRLYMAWVGQKVWEGTRIPRSSIPIFLAFQHIESLIPRILTEIFADRSWFEAAPWPGTSLAQVMAVRDLMLSQSEAMNIREQYRRIVKSGLIYGNGIGELMWETGDGKRRLLIPEDIPITKKVFDPASLRMVQAPTGSYRREWRERMFKEKINRPFFKYIPLKDFYIDPNCPSPDIKEAGFVCVRKLQTIAQLEALRGKPGFTIPDKPTLLELAKSRPSASVDSTKQTAEGYRGISGWNPDGDSTDPARKRIEVVAHVTKDRLVWMGNRQMSLYNSSNPYGFIPYYNSVYTDVLDRFFGLAVTDVVEGEQDLQEGIINARIDEMALSLNPPMTKKRGAQLSPYQLRTRPGQVRESDDPGNDFKPDRPSNVTQNAFDEVALSDQRAQRIDGVSDLAVLGVGGGGNSANRTATGVQTQSAAASSRISYLVENFETNLIEPLLYDWHTLNTRNLDPETVLNVLGPESKYIEINPLAVINAAMKFSMRASARMRSKAALLQVLPLISQTFMNPEFLNMLAKQQQKTLNIDEWANIVMEAVDYKARSSLFRQMSPEEIQSMNQPPQPDPTKMQMQRERLEAQGQTSEEKNRTDLIRAVIAEMSKQELGELKVKGAA